VGVRSVKRGQCPSCGAEVIFRSAVSILAVCDYCRSTLLRQDLELENLGKMAELLEDASPVQIGTEGRYRERHFTVVGRIQLKHGAGLWNEWHLLFDDESTGWLGETPGLCAVTFVMPPPEDCPAFEDLAIKLHLTIHGRDFQVVNLEKVRCIAGEGELPFRVGAGYDNAVADLRGPGQAFATLDYSETPPLLFVGEQVEFQSLSLANLRDVAVRGTTARTETFRCTQCGAPVTPKAEASVVIACGSCGSVIDLEDSRHPVLFQAALDKGIRPLIPLGSRGRLRGNDYEVIGFLQRETREEGIAYLWSEYLLFNLGGGFAWLSEYDGHWNYIQPTTHQPVFFRARGAEFAQYRERRFRHFQTSEATVTYVLGEFYWRVALGEKARVRDFVDPPWMLSEERMDKELLWSVGEYIDGEELREAFKIDSAFPEPMGVYANQPSPWQGKLGGYWRRFAGFALLLAALQAFFVLQDTRADVPRMTVQLDAGHPETAPISPVFDLPGGGRRDVEVEADLDSGDTRLVLKMDLVNDQGVALHGTREVSAYGGADNAVPGHRKTTLRFAGVPKGRYYLAVAAEGEGGATTAGQPVTCILTVRRAETSWGVFFLALLGLAAWPGWVSQRHNAFETRRWMWSDHPPESG
jgi:ribosomal protein L37AE/L43A